MELVHRFLRLRGLAGAVLLVWTPLWESVNFFSNLQFVAEYVPSLKQFMHGQWGTWLPPIFGVVLIVWALKDKRENIQFFVNQDALPGLRAEIRNVRAGDIVWPVGGSGNQIDDAALRNIRRLILGDPNATQTELQRRVDRYDASSVAEVQAATRSLTMRAQAQGVAVKWLPVPEASIIISNKTHWWERRWARIEIVVPFSESHHRPSILVTPKHRKLLVALKNAYDAMWAAAQDAEQLATPSVSHTAAQPPAPVS